MARLRKFVAYRKIERPYTRHSKYSNLSYVRARPVCRVVRFDMGVQTAKYDYLLELISKQDLQIRDNAIESARQAGLRPLEGKLGKSGYFLRCHAYPHHILRENPLASGAGADRLSTGMAHSFGKPMGRAAQVFKGKPVYSLRINKENLALGKSALKACSHKLPSAYQIVVTENKKK